jgi:hypothetical protein
VPERRKKNDDNPTDAPSRVEPGRNSKYIRTPKGDCVLPPHQLRVNTSPSDSINGDHTIVILPNNGYQYWYGSSKGLVQIKRFTEVRSLTGEKW